MYGASPLGEDFFEYTGSGKERRVRQQLFSQVYGGKKRYYEECSPSRAAKASKRAVPLDFELRVVVGYDDPRRWENSNFNRLLNSLHIRHSYYEVPDVGHDLESLLEGDMKRLKSYYGKVLGGRGLGE
jgi:hypothetical protein